MARADLLMSQNARPLIVIPGDDPPQCQGSPQIDRLEPYGDVRLYETPPADGDETVARAQGATAIINSRSRVKWPADVLRRLPDLRMITVCGIGTDAIDLDECRERGIVVSNIPGKTAPVVAEHAFGMMFAAAKQAAYQTQKMKAGVWHKFDAIFLRDKTVGVIGAGNIGAEMARLCRSIGMDVIAWTFHPSEERGRSLGVRFVELDELLSTADVVTIHLQETPESRHLIGARELGLMKQGSILVNVARGSIVDTEALVEALDSGRLAGAALDVFEEEPLPADHPLLGCEHVVLTPHVADMTPEGIELLNEGVVDNVIAFFEGRPQYVVT